MNYKQVYQVEAKNSPGIIKIIKGTIAKETNPKTFPKPGRISQPYSLQQVYSIYPIQDVKVEMDDRNIKKAEVYYTKTFEQTIELAKSELQGLSDLLFNSEAG